MYFFSSYLEDIIGVFLTHAVQNGKNGERKNTDKMKFKKKETFSGNILKRLTKQHRTKLKINQIVDINKIL